jgi:exonuclease SbcC
MITRVRLKNWRSHLDSELSFCEGTNGFIGPMGSGKTSVLDGICFALFGTFPNLQSKKIKLPDVVMKKPKAQQVAEVSVTFELAGNSWSVMRRIEKGRTAYAELRKDGQLVEAPQAQRVTEAIQRLLRIDYDLFTRAIYSEQNALDMFLTIPRGQRMRKIDQLLAIDRFELARRTVLSLINRAAAVMAEKQQLVRALEADESLASLSKLRQELQNTVDVRDKLRRELCAAADRKARALAALEQIKTAQRAASELDAQLAASIALQKALKRDIDGLTAELADVVESSDAELRAQLAELNARATVLSENVQTERQKLVSLTALCASKAAKVKFLEDEKIPSLRNMSREHEMLKMRLKKAPPKRLQTALQKKQKELDGQTAALHAVSAKLEQLRESLDLLVGKTCPVCYQPLSERKKRHLEQKKRTKIEKLLIEQKRLGLQRKRTEHRIRELEAALLQAETAQQKIDDLADASAQLKFATEALRVLRAELDSHDNEIKMLEKTISITDTAARGAQEKATLLKGILEKRARLLELMTKLRRQEASIAALEERKSSLPVITPDLITNAEREVQAAIESESQINVHLQNIGELITERQKRLKQLEEKRSLLEKYKSEVAKISAIEKQLRLLERALIATQRQLRNNFIVAVNQAMQSLWQTLYPYQDIFSIRLGIQEGDYVLQLRDSTGWIAADGVASGGERSIACLALRMAFSLVLAPQLRWLVLDEPTHNLDAKAVDDLATVLRDRIAEFVEQIFLITHDQALEAAVTGYLYRLERDKEKDSFTRVIKITGPNS